MRAGSKTVGTVVAAFFAASVAVASATSVGSAAAAAPTANPSGVVPVLFVGNNWDGTAT